MIELSANNNYTMTNPVNNLRARISKSGKSPSLLLPGESSGSASSSSKDPVQVEPKTYFANERTFIQWISAALLLLTVSSIMMGSGSYNGTSSVIAFSSLVLVAYASYVYFRRVKLLRSGQAYGYLDFVGPSILAAGVGVGVFIVFCDAIKGSEFLPWGKGKDKDDRRSLMSLQLQPPMPEILTAATRALFELEEMEDGTCYRHAIDGINLLEYQPRDILLNHPKKSSTEEEIELIVATPQALVSHPLLSGASSSAVLLEIPDSEIQSMTMVGDRLFALSVGPAKTELIEFHANPTDHSYMEMEPRVLIQESTSSAGSMIFVPSSDKLYIYLDGTMHSYHLHLSNNNDDESPSTSSLSLTGSINMKVLNQMEDDPITALEHFEGITYMLREKQNVIQAWDLNSASLLAEMPLPSVAKNDKWVGMTFQRRSKDGEENKTPLLRKGTKAGAPGAETSVYLHMPLDTFPPQLWSFRLEEQGDGINERTIFSFPECHGGAMN